MMGLLLLMGPSGSKASADTFDPKLLVLRWTSAHFYQHDGIIPLLVVDEHDNDGIISSSVEEVKTNFI